MKDQQAYWTSIAQVLPVLALAIVVEARVIVRSWTEETPRLFRAVFVVLWLFPLMVFAYSEPLALKAMRDAKDHKASAVVTDVAVTLAMSVLFVTPALGWLARAGAEQTARLLLWSPMTDRRRRSEVRKLRAELLALRNSTVEFLNMANATLDLAKEIADDVLQLPVDAPAYADVLRRAQAAVDESQKWLRIVLAGNVEATAWIEQARARLRVVERSSADGVVELRQELAGVLLRLDLTGGQPAMLLPRMPPAAVYNEGNSYYY